MDKFLTASVAVVLLFFGGCKRESAARPVVVEVVTNAAAVAAARQAFAERQERRLAELLSNPQEIQSFDPESLELIRSQTGRSVAALTGRRDNKATPAEVWLQSACALKILGVATPPEQLAALGRANGAASRALLFAIQGDDLWKHNEPLPEPIKGFVVECLSNSDTGLRSSAAHVVSWRKIEEAAGPLAALIQEQPKPDMQLLKAAARLQPSAELLRQLQPQLNGAGGLGGNGALGAIADLGKAATDPVVKRAAATVCARFLTQQPDQPWIDGDTGAAVMLIAGLKPPETAAELLKGLVRSGKWRIVREMALGDLKKLDAAAAKALAEETGLDVRRDSGQRADSPNPKQTMEGLAAICVKQGLLTQADADQAVAKGKQPSAAKNAGDEAASPEALFLAAGRFLMFDVETGTSPNRHDRLLLDFAKASAGQFRPEAVLEDYQDAQARPKGGGWVTPGLGKYRVQFVHLNRLYQFEPRDLGDWYDVEAVVTAIHRALEDAGVQDRFVALESGGQDAGFIFAQPGQLKTAAADLGLTLGTDLDQARKLGTAFEENALKELRK